MGWHDNQTKTCPVFVDKNECVWSDFNLIKSNTQFRQKTKNKTKSKIAAKINTA